MWFTLEPMPAYDEKSLEKANQWKFNELLHLQGLAYETRARGWGDGKDGGDLSLSLKIGNKPHIANQKHRPFPPLRKVEQLPTAWKKTILRGAKS